MTYQQIEAILNRAIENEATIDTQSYRLMLEHIKRLDCTDTQQFELRNLLYCL